MNEWIKVENGAPELHSEVLITDGKHVVKGHIMYFNPLVALCDNGLPFYNITHWMRLPKAPNE